MDWLRFLVYYKVGKGENFERINGNVPDDPLLFVCLYFANMKEWLFYRL